MFEVSGKSYNPVLFLIIKLSRSLTAFRKLTPKFIVFSPFSSQRHSEPCQASKMERFAKIINDQRPLTIFAKRSILDVFQSSEYASAFSHKMLWWYHGDIHNMKLSCIMLKNSQMYFMEGLMRCNELNPNKE